jgi:lysozyme
VISAKALALIKEFEGFRAQAYRDPVGIVTIGYGTTGSAGVGITPKMGDTITEAQASEYLMRAVDKFSVSIKLKLTRPATPEQFGAMVSLAYNIGPGAFAKSSVLKRFNAGDIQGAADAFLMWNKAGGKVLNGLTRRREAERALFLSPHVTETPKTEHVAPVVLPKPYHVEETEPKIPHGRPSFLAALFAAIMAILKGAKR